uniref:Uncharacterized protein n=1 Tax=Romanomermis culicivorax TaxID=13658 RepID=A0A915J1T5_ROMCU
MGAALHMSQSQVRRDAYEEYLAKERATVHHLNSGSKDSHLPSSASRLLFDLRKPKAIDSNITDSSLYPNYPVSPYLYPRHNFLHNSDSRILGADFVLLALRPDDNVLRRVEKLLQEAKNNDNETEDKG